ncbi:MAG: GTPase HflX, partial [Planctomycetota bacterium]|nr:GTPase HflX [Planctomycetota bacterium]
MISLSKTADIEVRESLVQKLSRPNAATWVGAGKVAEAAELAQELDVDFIITDNDLSPAQERNIEKITEKTVIDRSQLIMDIFAQRAQTPQARLQVELAQLRYSLPRLKRMWTHLSRYEGGIGMRGPGEKQLETDKRLIGRRIQKMVRDLKHIERRNQVAIENRSGEFVVALAGYTNAGKSTLLNTLTRSDELVEDKLFATLDTRVRRWILNERRHVLLTDTVGFIKDLPHHLVASFEATLTETRRADIILHVVDASSPQAEQHIRTVNKVLQSLKCGDKMTWMVLNKWDALTSEEIPEANNLASIGPDYGS